MFQINDTIMYGTQGICTITDITEKSFMGSKKEYFVLKPLNSAKATFFAPKDSDKAASKMRSLLSQEEVYSLIDKIPDQKPNWIENENERKDEYKRIIAGGDHLELIGMIKAIYRHKEKREADGKHLYLSDERFVKEAERILYEEFQYVLDISRDELLSYIESRIRKAAEENGNDA